MVYAFWTRKGGVGKTTCATNTAWLSPHRTILVDCDSQGNASSYLLQQDPTGELVDVLEGRSSLQSTIVSVGHLSLLPTKRGSTLKAFSETRLFQEPYLFADLNETLSQDYELIIYDLGPGLSQLERCAILAADEVVSPVLAEAFSVDGVETAREDIAGVAKAFRTEVLHRKLIVNMLNQSFRRHRQAWKRYQGTEYDLYSVPQDAKLAEAQYMRMPLAEYDGNARSLPELRRLAEALEV